MNEKELKDALQEAKYTLTKYKVGEHFMMGLTENSINTIISALDKQIPKKPLGDLHCVPHFRCPSCKSSVRTLVSSTKTPYCAWCGQKLDWGEKDD